MNSLFLLIRCWFQRTFGSYQRTSGWIFAGGIAEACIIGPKQALQSCDGRIFPESGFRSTYLNRVLQLSFRNVSSRVWPRCGGPKVGNASFYGSWLCIFSRSESRGVSSTSSDPCLFFALFLQLYQAVLRVDGQESLDASSVLQGWIIFHALWRTTGR